MRDGMPGPGWWIASDGRWYPPELHPDMRASSAVALAEPAAATATTPTGDAKTSLFDGHHDVPNGTAAVFAHERSTNGSRVAAPAPATVTDESLATAPVASGGRRRRFPLGLAVAVATLLVIIYLAGGRDARPSLDTEVATTDASGAALAAPATSDATPQPTSASVPAAPASAKPGASTASAPSTTATRQGTAQGTAPAAKVTPHVVSVFDLVKGNCLDGPNLTDGLVTTIRVVDCSEVHTHEVYYSGRYPDATFDSVKISNYANDTCLAQFAPYVGVDYTRSRYQYLHIVPTQDSWTRDNDRDVVCVAFEEDATITGSIAGRAQ